MRLKKSVVMTVAVIAGLTVVGLGNTLAHAAEYAATLPDGAQVKREKPTWGKAVNGLQLGIRLDFLNRPYGVGEMAAITLLVRNVSKQPLKLIYTKPDWGIVPNVLTEKGKPLGLSQQGQLFVPSSDMPVHIINSILTPKQTLEVGQAWLVIGANGNDRSHAILDVNPGKYQMRYTLDFLPGINEQKGSVARVWSGRLTSGMIMLHVVPKLESGNGLTR